MSRRNGRNGRVGRDKGEMGELWESCRRVKGEMRKLHNFTVFCQCTDKNGILRLNVLDWFVKKGNV
jgi:hypothetical protein